MVRRKVDLVDNQEGASHNMATAQYPRGCNGDAQAPWKKRGNSISAEGTIVYSKEYGASRSLVISKKKPSDK